MKNSKRKILALAMVSALLLSGCGTAFYELTEDEQNFVAHYAAYAVAKHNKYQKDGMNAKSKKALLENEAKVQEHLNRVQETLNGQGGGSTSETNPNTGDGTQQNPGEVGANAQVQPGVLLKDVLGYGEAVQISYEGYELNKNYDEGTYLSIGANAGKTFVIMKFSLKNVSGQNVTADALSKKLAFSMADGETIKANALTTLSMADLATYQGTIAAGQTVTNVLLFEVDDAVAQSVKNPQLRVKNGSNISNVKIS